MILQAVFYLKKQRGEEEEEEKEEEEEEEEKEEGEKGEEGEREIIHMLVYMLVWFVTCLFAKD